MHFRETKLARRNPVFPIRCSGLGRRVRMNRIFHPSWAAWRGGHGQVRNGMALVRRMIELSGDPAVGQWLPLRMAARAGDLPFVEWLIGLSHPSDYAVSDAIAWASYKGRSAVIERLERFAAEGR